MTVRLSKRYGFVASHRLHSPALSDAENAAIYGKCNNPFGHGHNYEVELTVRGPVDEVTGRVVDLRLLDRVAEEQILAPFRHRNLNEEIDAFRTVVPTTENLSYEVDRRLRSVWQEVFGPSGPRLERVRIWETERNICEVEDYETAEAGSR
ncbi:MAG TPA: 6-carboxytetrahydropterin synthase [Bryobacteraceae bacterium]|nr:6-carboxytetrahydropterin synthase [Bryobacteraceae bacterium]